MVHGNIIFRRPVNPDTGDYLEDDTSLTDEHPDEAGESIIRHEQEIAYAGR